MSETINMAEKRALELNAQISEALEVISPMAKCGSGIDVIIKMVRKMGFSEEVIQLALKQYEDQTVGAKKTSTLHGERYKSLMNWYHPVKSPSPDSRWGRLVRILQGRGWPESNIENLNAQSDDVVSSLASPKTDKKESVKGLVLGYVQSGKTANFSAVIAKATDEGYKLVIVLSGRHNGLRSQTEKRLQSELAGDNKSTFNLTDVGPKGDFTQPTQHPNSLLSTDEKFTLAVMKKNSAPLEKFSRWISQTDPQILANCPVLIVDDEANEASVNNASDPDDDPTKINRIIRKMIDFFSSKTVCSYVGYTATPFANVLIDAQEESDLFPRDFIIALNAPSSYTGTERLFGRASIDSDGGKVGLDLIRNIDPTDAITRDDQNTRSLPKTMREAILSFLLSAGERMRRGHLHKHITMLIHTSHLKAQHGLICDIIEDFKKEFEHSFSAKDKTLINELRSIFISDHKKTNESFGSVKIGQFEEILEGVDHFLQNLKIIKENSESESRLNFDNGPVWAIIVGGNTLSRGLTIEGLTTSYFHRTTDGYDTLLQMGRWFGYRDEFLDLTRIYVTEEMAANFYHLATVEHELREDIYRMQVNGERPIDLSLKIRDHDRLSITNKNVIRNAAISSKSYSGSKIQATHVYINDKEKAQRNLRTIQSLVRSADSKAKLSVSEVSHLRDCILYRDVPHEIVLNFIKSYEFSPLDKKFNYSLIRDYTEKLALLGEMTNWSVVIYSNLATRSDSTLELGINNLKVVPVSRSCSKTYSLDDDVNGVVLRTLTAPKDEMIDLTDIDAQEIKKMLFGEGKEITDIEFRNLRPSNRPLLLIYPLETNPNLGQDSLRSQSREKFSPVIAPFEHLFGISIVFPRTTRETFDCTYKHNETIDTKRNKVS